jgi:hypothetical protein
MEVSMEAEMEVLRGHIKQVSGIIEVPARSIDVASKHDSIHLRKDSWHSQPQETEHEQGPAEVVGNGGDVGSGSAAAPELECELPLLGSEEGTFVNR